MLSGCVGWLNGGSGLVDCAKKVDMYIHKKKSFSIHAYRVCVPYITHLRLHTSSGTIFVWLFCPKIGGGVHAHNGKGEANGDSGIWNNLIVGWTRWSLLGVCTLSRALEKKRLKTSIRPTGCSMLLRVTACYIIQCGIIYGKGWECEGVTSTRKAERDVS